MTNEEKINILENMLNKYGLSTSSRPFSYFFYEIRQLAPLTNKGEENLTYSHLVKPTSTTILPSDVENASYGDLHNLEMLYDWYLYQNAGDNALVFQNLESDPGSLIASFSQAKQEASNSMRIDRAGRVFNGNDGNHRLLTLILKHAAERLSAKTEVERLAVDAKYKMTIPLQYPLSKELATLLREQQPSETKGPYPKLALQFRENAFDCAGEKDYYATFNPATQEYSYSFNGVKFQGTEEQLIEFLKTKEASTEPILTYNCGNVYYISCNNKVWKTRNKEKANQLIAKIRQSYKEEKFPSKQYLEVKDCDASEKEYSILFPQFALSDAEREETARAIASQMLKLVQNPETNILGQKGLNHIKEQCEKAQMTGDLFLDAIQLDSLSKEEYVQISQLFDQMEALIFPEDADYKQY